jgi:hypothetical protein
MFHGNQSIYLEFGTIGRCDFVVVGSNKRLLGGEDENNEVLNEEPNLHGARQAMHC